MKFDHIVYEPLRTWNSCVMFFNIGEDEGFAAAQVYLSSFSKEEKAKMLAMYQRVKAEGRDAVLKSITKNMPLQEDDDNVQ